MVTSPISTQEKMKLIPTPLFRTDTQSGQMRAETEELGIYLALANADSDLEPAISLDDHQRG